MDDEKLLVFLALQAGLHGSVKTSTARIAGHFRVSQQTASRKLRNLKKAGLIRLFAGPSGCTVSLAPEGARLLRADFLSLKQVFGPGTKKMLRGKIKDGLGEGRYYVSRPYYLKQFKNLLGFKPFFGTLNLIVDIAELNSFLLGLHPIKIEGFETDERSFGTIRAFKVTVQGKQQAALIMPERTAHPKNEIEVIAPTNLRKKFKLGQGRQVTLTA